MEQGRLAFTALYLKSNSGYIGFIEQLPGVNSHGRTLDEAARPCRSWPPSYSTKSAARPKS